MDQLNQIIEILFRSSCANDEQLPHSDGVDILVELKSYLEEHGAEVDIQYYEKIVTDKTYRHANLIARPVDSTGPYVAFQGHIDTVPCGETYSYSVSDTKITGRGAVDMKGPLAGCIDAFINLISQGKKNVALIITDDEETDFAGINKLIEEKDKYLKNINICINAEPTNLTAAFLTRGFGQYEITASGNTGHSSSSANDRLIEKMVPVISAINDFVSASRQISDPIYGETRSAFTVLQSGIKSNQLPDHFRLICNMRLVTSDIEQYKKLFEQIVRPNLTAEMQVNELYLLPSASQVDQKTREIISQTCTDNSIDYRESVMHAFTEACLFNQAGIPAFSWGPGQMDLAHVRPSDEIIKLADIEKYSQLLQSFVSKIV